MTQNLLLDVASDGLELIEMTLLANVTGAALAHSGAAGMIQMAMPCKCS